MLTARGVVGSPVEVELLEDVATGQTAAAEVGTLGHGETGGHLQHSFTSNPQRLKGHLVVDSTNAECSLTGVAVLK